MVDEAGYQAVVAAPGFALGVRCDDEEIIEIEFIEARPEVAPVNALAAETVRQLRAYLAEVPAGRFKTPMKVKEIPRLFTPETFCKLVISAQREVKAAG